jgi:hypothetical protein
MIDFQYMQTMRVKYNPGSVKQAGEVKFIDFP